MSCVRIWLWPETTRQRSGLLHEDGQDTKQVRHRDTVNRPKCLKVHVLWMMSYNYIRSEAYIIILYVVVLKDSLKSHQILFMRPQEMKDDKLGVVGVTLNGN